MPGRGTVGLVKDCVVMVLEWADVILARGLEEVYAGPPSGGSVSATFQKQTYHHVLVTCVPDDIVGRFPSDDKLWVTECGNTSPHFGAGEYVIQSSAPCGTAPVWPAA